MASTFIHGVQVVESDAGARPIRTARSGLIGIVGTAPDADAAVFPFNEPVLVAGSRLKAAALDTVGDGGGTLPAALDGIFDQIGAVVIVVRVEEGSDDEETMANVVGGVNSSSGKYEGVHALLGAESGLGFAPRILCAPGFTHQRPEDTETPGEFLANPVVTEMLGLVDRMRAVIIADGPNAQDEDAIAYADDWGSDRIYLIDPWVQVLDSEGAPKTEPASARVAGVIAKTDNDRGFWHSPSNQTIAGIIGLGRPVDFKMGDANSRANLLNEKNVSTIIRQNGFRLWGNRSLSDDQKWAFLQTRRTADLLHESLQAAHLWAVDRNITKTYVEDVADGVNAYIRSLVAQGALLGGSCWPDPDLNTAQNIAQGKVFFNFDFTPPYPAEHITFRSHLVNDYIVEALG